MTTAIRPAPATAELPPHGERRCYLRGCRQPECVQANKRYCKQYLIRRHRNGHRQIDGAPAAAHLQELLAQGWTQAGIEKVAGISHYTISTLARGAQNKVLRETSERILAFQPDDRTPRPGYWTDPTGTIRRIQALAVIGHPIYAVAAAVGADRSALRCLINGQRQKVNKDVARKIADLYPAWILKPGPSPTARGMARARGWHGPLAWDDIDDPQAAPDLDGTATQAPVARKRDRLRNEEIEHLAGFGIDAAEIGRRLGLNERDVAERIKKWRMEARTEKRAVAS